MTVDSMSFRDALGRFTSGVCVVTMTGKDGRPSGVTISSFSSLSLRPPLVLFCIGKQSSNLAAWLEAPLFSVNVLSELQQSVAELFASQAPDKFADVEGRFGSNGCFCLEGALVTLECRRSGVHDQGDHYIIVGLVENVVLGSGGAPLIRFRGAYRRLTSG